MEKILKWVKRHQCEMFSDESWRLICFIWCFYIKYTKNFVLRKICLLISSLLYKKFVLENNFFICLLTSYSILWVKKSIMSGLFLTHVPMNHTTLKQPPLDNILAKRPWLIFLVTWGDILLSSFLIQEFHI